MLKKTLFLIVIILVNIVAYGEEGLSYWNAVKKYEMQMSDTEKIEAFSKVIPADLSIIFYSEQEFDGKHYGHFRCYVDRIPWKGEPIVSEKKIKNGLYENQYPMMKINSGRDDIKWFWFPSTNTYWCIFFKFSLGGNTTKWISLGKMPNQFGSVIEEFSCENPDVNTFKLEGIRVIYNCDYEILTNYSKEIKAFMNDDKANSTHLISAGAKYLELRNAEFNSIDYDWVKGDSAYTYSSEHKKMGSITILSDSSPIIDKINEEKRLLQEEEERQRKIILEAEEKKRKEIFLEFRKDKDDFYNNETRFIEINKIHKVGEMIKENKDSSSLDVYCFGEISGDEIFVSKNTDIKDYFNSMYVADNIKDELMNDVNEMKTNYKLILETVYNEKYKKLRSYLFLNILSKRDGFESVYILPTLELGENEIEEDFLIEHFDEIQINMEADGYRFPFVDECNLIAKKKKALKRIHLSKNTKITPDFVQDYFIVRKNNDN